MGQLDHWGAVIPLGHSGAPLDPAAWMVFENFCKNLGLTEFGQVSYFAVVNAWRPGTQPPPVVQPPVPWWASLKIGDVVHIAREGVPVRNAPSPEGEIWKILGMMWGDMLIAAGVHGVPGVEPIPDSEDAWLKVNPDPLPLWVKASDVKRK